MKTNHMEKPLNYSLQREVFFLDKNQKAVSIVF